MLSVSYKNYEIDEENKLKQKLDYGSELLRQINEKRRKKDEEKKRKLDEEREEEERLQRERELLLKRYEDELNKNKAKLINDKVISNPREETKNDSKTNNEENFDSYKHLLPSYFTELYDIEKNYIKKNGKLFDTITEIKYESQTRDNRYHDTIKELNKLKEEINIFREEDEQQRKDIYNAFAEKNYTFKKAFSLNKEFAMSNNQIKKNLIQSGNGENLRYQVYDHDFKSPPKLVLVEDKNNKNLKEESNLVYNKSVNLHNPINPILNSLNSINMNNSTNFDQVKRFYNEEKVRDIKPIVFKKIPSDKKIVKLEDFKQEVNNYIDRNTLNAKAKIDLGDASYKLVEARDEDKNIIQNIYNKNIERLKMLNAY